MAEQPPEPLARRSKVARFFSGFFQCFLVANSLAFLLFLIALRLVSNDETYRILHWVFVWLPTVVWAAVHYVRKQPWIANGILGAALLSFALSCSLQAELCVYPFPLSILLLVFSM